MKKYLFGISVLALIASGHVRAADVVQAYDAPEVAPVSVAPAFSWGGFYIGGQLGGSWSDTAVSSNLHGGTFIISTMTPLDLMDGSLLRFSPDPSGFVGGIYAGYNFDLGNDVIIGVILMPVLVLSNNGQGQRGCVLAMLWIDSCLILLRVLPMARSRAQPMLICHKTRWGLILTPS